MRIFLGVLLVLLAALGPDQVAEACPMPPVKPPPTIEDGPRGRLTVTSRPEARVWIDGSFAGVTPVRGRYLDAGTHRLRTEASCGRSTRSVRVRPGADVRVSLSPCSSARP